MSLIHKALKKTEQGDTPGDLSKPELPVEEFVGNKKGFMSTDVTPRTVILLVLALSCLGYMVYTKLLKKPKMAPPPQPAAMVAVAPVPVKTDLPKGLLTEGDENGASKVRAIGTPEEEQPEAFRKLTTSAKEFFLNGQLEEALAKFQEADKVLAGEPTVLNNMGLIYKKMNKLKEAEANYKKALEKFPEYAECLNNLGALKVAQESTLDAALYFRKAIDLKPNYADAYFNLAVLMENEGNYRSAIDSYKQFLKYAGDSDEALLSQVRERIEELAK